MLWYAVWTCRKERTKFVPTRYCNITVLVLKVFGYVVDFVLDFYWLKKFLLFFPIVVMKVFLSLLTRSYWDKVLIWIVVLVYERNSRYIDDLPHFGDQKCTKKKKKKKNTTLIQTYPTVCCDNAVWTFTLGDDDEPHARPIRSLNTIAAAAYPICIYCSFFPTVPSTSNLTLSTRLSVLSCHQKLGIMIPIYVNWSKVPQFMAPAVSITQKLPAWS